jgi:hypothetical protein
MKPDHKKNKRNFNPGDADAVSRISHKKCALPSLENKQNWVIREEADIFTVKYEMNYRRKKLTNHL